MHNLSLILQGIIRKSELQIKTQS